ncbi:MAG: polysaccharide biosynthesis tyrosine autokinase, partial [Actinomycetota bacterium]
ELDSELARTGTARVIQLAAPPRDDANPPLSRNLILGAVIGLVVGCAAALAADNLDRTIKTADDISGVPVLGAIPKPGRELRQRDMSLATMNHTGTAVAEAYQKVRTSVEFAVLGRRLTSLLITSPNQSEGKTTTSSNLAWAMSAVDHRVVLADVDFRRPRLHEVFGCRLKPGLSDNLLKQIPLNKLALRVDDDRRNLVIIPTGTRPPSPADFVAAPAFAGLIDRLENEADLVVLDAPPILPVSDALSMARQVDAVIVVAKAGSTGRDQLQETIDALRAVGADVLGVCLVGVRSDPSRYGYEQNEPKRSRRRRSTEGAPAGATIPDPADEEPDAPATIADPGPARRRQPAPEVDAAPSTLRTSTPPAAPRSSTARTSDRAERSERNEPPLEMDLENGDGPVIDLRTQTGETRSSEPRPATTGSILAGAVDDDLLDGPSDDEAGTRLRR